MPDNKVVDKQPTASADPPESAKGYPQNIMEWSTGVCGCCEDCQSCCYAFWCYRCFLCTLTRKMNENRCGLMCCGAHHAVIHLPMLPTSPNIYLVALRTKLRTLHGIQGSVCNDILCMWCCEFCSTTQMMRQLKHFGIE